MPYYKISSEDSGYESGYESDGETEYSPLKPLGKGYYTQARLFKSKSNKSVAVLNPVETPGDIGEATVKHRFFQTVYPKHQSHLFTMKNDYRLVIPYIPYIPYEELNIDTPEFQKILFHSAIQALKDCHEKGIIVLDLKTDNAYYDSSTKKTYLIDGGLSAVKGREIDALAFQKTNQGIVDKYKLEYSHIPPECWSVRPTPVLATTKMDIYSLGVMMSDTFENPSSEIQSLIDSCLEKVPEKRPTLLKLESSLNSVNISEKVVNLEVNPMSCTKA
jgi:serine/threonine protein kinase